MKRKLIAVGVACAALAGCVWVLIGHQRHPLAFQSTDRNGARTTNELAEDSWGLPGTPTQRVSPPPERGAAEYDLASLSIEQRARIERSLDVLSRVERDAKNRGDRVLLAQVESERGRLVKATTGVDDERALPKATQ